ncbi:MAG: helix-turn-helix domain-containing protein [Alphaproteobacteria bacterium]|nr:helix-turn-helix domain-containing protein [Alphaproteobacteria bacterium]
MLHISLREMCRIIGIEPVTMSNFENGKNIHKDTLEKIETYYLNAGLEFTEGNGVREKRDFFIIYRGADGFRQFMDQVYEVARAQGGKFCCYNVTPANWLKWLGEEWNAMHAERMAAIADKLDFRITVKYGDIQFIGKRHAEYRWIPDKLWHDQTIYVYGDFIGFMVFRKDDVTIKVLKDKDVHAHIMGLFDHIWETASIIPKGVAHGPNNVE